MHRKVFNLVLIWKTTAIVWSSIPSIFGKSAQVMLQILQAVIPSIESTLSVDVVALVADNENANNSLFRQLEAWRP